MTNELEVERLLKLCEENKTRKAPITPCQFCGAEGEADAVRRFEDGRRWTTWGAFWRCGTTMLGLGEETHQSTLCELTVALRRNAELEKLVEGLRAKLKTIVVTEGIDKGVVLLSNDGPCHRDPETGVMTYDHENFSPLGDALIELWELLQPKE